MIVDMLTFLKLLRQRRCLLRCSKILLVVCFVGLFLKWFEVFQKCQPPQYIPLTVIVSRMRSGSTFTGDIFRASPGSFYLFEPLQFISSHVGNSEIVFMNGTSRFYNISEMAEVQAQIINNWLTCNLDDINHQSFLPSHFLYHNHLKQHYFCQLKVKGDREAMREKCLPWLKQRCEKATSRTLKLISIDMRAIQILYDLSPNVSVIYLVRDPRAVLYSQLNVQQIKKVNIENESSSHCDVVKKDLTIAKNIRTLPWSRLHVQHYERLAAEPSRQFRYLFEFTGLDFYQTPVIDRLRNIALRKGLVSSCKWCSEKGDALAASIKWRKNIPFEFMLEIQKQCSKVIQNLHYLFINNKDELRDTSFSLLT